MEESSLRIGEVARAAGVRKSLIGSDPFSPRLRALARRRLPEIERLIARATQMRAWLDAATRCECVTVDECALFDEPALAPRASGATRAAVAGPAAGRGRDRGGSR